MANRRIEYDAQDGSHYSQVLNLLSAYREAIEAGNSASAAGAADRAAHLAETLADHALLDADQSERAIAADMGVPRSTVQYRIKRARARIHGEDQA